MRRKEMYDWFCLQRNFVNGLSLEGYLHLNKLHANVIFKASKDVVNILNCRVILDMQFQRYIQ